MVRWPDSRTATGPRSQQVGRRKGIEVQSPLGPLEHAANRPVCREVLDCASPLALFEGIGAFESGRGLAQSKTLTRGSEPRCAMAKSWDFSLFVEWLIGGYP